jgi:hypothetical protein
MGCPARPCRREGTATGRLRKVGTTPTMPPTTSLRFGDIVLVPFPFTDQSGTKRRPAIVVSSAGYQARRRDIVIMAVTSRMRTTPAFGEFEVAEWRNTPASSSPRSPSPFSPRSREDSSSRSSARSTEPIESPCKPVFAPFLADPTADPWAALYHRALVPRCTGAGPRSSGDTGQDPRARLP